MTRILLPLLALILAAMPAAAEPPQVLATGLKWPFAVAAGPGGKLYVLQHPEGDNGSIVTIDSGKPEPFCTGLDRPIGIVGFRQWLFVTDQRGILRVDVKGKSEIYVPAKDFPVPLAAFAGITADPETGILYVSAAVDVDAKQGAIYQIATNRKVTLVADNKTHPGLIASFGLVMDGQSNLLIGSGSEIVRLRLVDKKLETLVNGQAAIGGIVFY
ncbi:MAG: hypothetical protein ACJ8F7_05980, partial [Gemmataceae bacterium]